LLLAPFVLGIEPARRTLGITVPFRKTVRSDTRLGHAPVVALPEGFQDLLRCDRRLVEAHADRVVYRVCDRRDHGVERTLAGLFRPEWPLRVDALDHDGLERRRVERGRQLVVEQRRLLVETAAEDLLLRDYLSVSHVRGALDLPLDVRRVERAAAVVRGRARAAGSR